MKTDKETKPVNLFGIDCMKCSERNDLMEMTIDENGAVLCTNCLSNSRIEKMIDISKESFIVPFERDWKHSWIYNY